MKICRSEVKTFKIKNRRGYAAMYRSHLTEGKTTQQAIARMGKALRRSGITIAYPRRKV